MKIRFATSNDFESIFMMGFDVWSDGLSVEQYLKSCSESTKYKKGQFIVLEKNEELIASLIIYDFGKNQYGIGSIAVPENLRNKGYGSKIIQETIFMLEAKSQNISIFLYSDINYKFYEKFGFKPLLKSQQKYSSSTCMVKNIECDKSFQDIPNYF